MLKLFYFPQICSLCPHILLEELGVPYELETVDLRAGQNREPSYLGVNPTGQLPTLQIVDGKYLTENIAIIDYLCTTHPAAELAPTEYPERAQWLSLLSRFASTYHPTFTRLFMSQRMVSDEAAAQQVAAAARNQYISLLDELNRRLDGNDWIFGSRFGAADCYAMVFYNWAVLVGLPLDDLTNLDAWKDRMLQRPAVRKVLEAEGSKICSVD